MTLAPEKIKLWTGELGDCNAQSTTFARNGFAVPSTGRVQPVPTLPVHCRGGILGASSRIRVECSLRRVQFVPLQLEWQAMGDDCRRVSTLTRAASRFYRATRGMCLPQSNLGGKSGPEDGGNSGLD